MSKPEKLSDSYLEMQAQIFPYVNDWAPLLSFISKIFNKMIVEHDWSTQEISYILLQLLVQSSSWAIVSLNCHPEDVQFNLIILESSQVSTKYSVL
jgi:hypothetical protein